MPDFLEHLNDKHKVKPNVSGRGQPPPFDDEAGTWSVATKSPHVLLLIEESEDGRLVCQTPALPKDRFRLGQINLTSLYQANVVAFRIWCAAKHVDQPKWQLLSDISWYLAFRLDRRDVNTIKRTFEGHSQSGIEFRFEPKNGNLSVYTQKRVVPCAYLRAGLLLNNSDSDTIGFKEYQYHDATIAIQELLKIRSLTRTSSEGG